MSFFFNVPEADVPLHTAGIVSSMYQSSGVAKGGPGRA